MFCGRTEKLTAPVADPISRYGETRETDGATRRRAIQEVGAADEAGHETCPRCVVQRHRIIHLLDPAVVHHDDAVGCHHRFGLVVRHINRRDAERVMQPTDLRPHLLAQVGIQVGQRFIEQQHLRLDNDRPRQCDALLLAAR